MFVNIKKITEIDISHIKFMWELKNKDIYFYLENHTFLTLYFIYKFISSFYAFQSDIISEEWFNYFIIWQYLINLLFYDFLQTIYWYISTEYFREWSVWVEGCSIGAECLNGVFGLRVLVEGSGWEF